MSVAAGTASAAAPIPTLAATRYVQPLREGGSLPAVVDTEDGLFVAKFRGAGQGPRALIAELVVGLLARTLGLPVPDLAIIALSHQFGRNEPDPEIRDVLRASAGLNVGLRYLDGAFNYDDHAAGTLVSPDLAARIVWLDAFLTNPDRTARNPNLLIWDRRPWLIDHGSALYFHHSWQNVTPERARSPFPLIREHVLLERAGDIAAADHSLAGRLDDSALAGTLRTIPDALLLDPLARGAFDSADQARDAYRRYLVERLREPRAFVQETIRAGEQRRIEPRRPLGTRR